MRTLGTFVLGIAAAVAFLLVAFLVVDNLAVVAVIAACFAVMTAFARRL